MNLPLFLVENIRALTLRVVENGKNGNNPLVIIPVLGKYWKDELISADFVNRVPDPVNGGSISVKVFVDDVFQNFDVKRNIVDVAEIKIDLVDGNSSLGPVQINDTLTLGKIAATWNSYIAGMAQYSCPLVTIGTDAGIASLNMVMLTSFWNPFGGSMTNEIKRKSIGLPKFPPQKFMSTSVGDINPFSPYNGRQVLLVSSSGKILSQAWEFIQQNWISPIIQNSFTDANLGTYSYANRVSAGYREPNQLTLLQGDQSKLFSEKHFDMAKAMIRQKDSPPPQWQVFLEEQAKLGRGGMLGSIGSLFGPMFGALGSTIDKVVGT